VVLKISNEDDAYFSENINHGIELRLTSDSLGRKIPDRSNVDDAIEHIMNPDMKEPDTSRIMPTNTGAMNIDSPEKVIKDPQMTDTFSGAIFANSMV